MKKLSLNPDALTVQSFQPAPNSVDIGEVVIVAAASNESVCMFTAICTCDFTACCHH